MMMIKSSKKSTEISRSVRSPGYIYNTDQLSEQRSALRIRHQLLTSTGTVMQMFFGSEIKMILFWQMGLIYFCLQW